MAGETVGPCPHCHSRLESGWLGFSSGLFWSRDHLAWWESLVPLAFRRGRFVVGGFGCTPWFRSRHGYRCVGCGALVVRGDP